MRAVRFSRLDNSGCMCRSRRVSINLGRSFSAAWAICRARPDTTSPASLPAANAGNAAPSNPAVNNRHLRFIVMPIQEQSWQVRNGLFCQKSLA